MLWDIGTLEKETYCIITANGVGNLLPKKWQLSHRQIEIVIIIFYIKKNLICNEAPSPSSGPTARNCYVVRLLHGL